MIGTTNSYLPPLTSIVEKKNTIEVSGAKVPIVLQNIFPCVQQKKETECSIPLTSFSMRVVVLKGILHFFFACIIFSIHH